MITRTNEILHFFYSFRFLTRIQTQSLLGYKHFNRIIAWLNELTNIDYLRRYYNPKTVTIPAVCSLGLKGRAYLRKTHGRNINISLLDRVWREKTFSLQFRECCLF